jgi:hypothetical protein
MKKNLVLFVLFILPIVAYLFFASGVNSFIKLPVITNKISDFPAWKNLDGATMGLQGKITVLGFGGYDLHENRGNLFNLNQKIYERYHEFKNLQFVYVCPIGTEQIARQIKSKFATFSDVSNLHFVFAPDNQIQDFYRDLKVRGKLSDKLSTPNVFLIDKNLQLRGRNGDEYKESYNTFHPSEISNELLDDFKILLYEYRAAFKRNLDSK